MVKTLHNFLWLFIVSFLWGACQQKQVQVGLLVSDANRQTAELAALCEHIASEKTYVVSILKPTTCLVWAIMILSGIIELIRQTCRQLKLL